LTAYKTIQTAHTAKKFREQHPTDKYIFSDFVPHLYGAWDSAAHACPTLCPTTLFLWRLFGKIKVELWDSLSHTVPQNTSLSYGSIVFMEIFGFNWKNLGLKENADAKPIVTETTATN
jgi:hypothetical protein